MGLLLLPVLTRFLSPKDYGIMALISILGALLGGFYSLGTGNSLGLCYHEAPDPAERSRVIWTAAAVVFASSLLLTLLGFALAPQISSALFGSPEHARLIRLSLAALAVSTTTAPFMAYFQLEERAKTYVTLSAVSAAATLALSLLAVVRLGRGVAGLFEAGLAGSLIYLSGAIAAALPRLQFGLNLRWVSPLVRIGFPSVFGIGAFFLIDWSDRVMIERFSGLGEVGIYSVGYSFGMVISLAVAAFANAWPPYFISFLNRREEAAGLFGRILKYYVLAFGTLTLLFFLMAKPVIVLLTAPPFHGAFTVVGLAALAYMLKGCYLIMLPALVFEKKLHLQTGIEWAAAAVNVALNFILIPLFRAEGAAAATAVAYFCLPLFTYAVGRKYLPVQYDWRGMARFAAGFVALACLSYVPLPGAPFSNIVVGLLCFALCGIYGAYAALSGQERSTLINFLVAAKSRLLR